MNLVGHEQWRDGVIAYYGGLSKFPDARTVRIMLGFLTQKIKEEVDFRITLANHPETFTDWVAHSQALLDKAEVYVKELRGWLRDRDLVES